jgi:hypothetical protein
MHPDVRRDLTLLRQLEHVNRRRVSPFLARPAFQGRFQFPDRRIARAADRIERQAGAGLAKGLYAKQFRDDPQDSSEALIKIFHVSYARSWRRRSLLTDGSSVPCSLCDQRFVETAGNAHASPRRNNGRLDHSLPCGSVRLRRTPYGSPNRGAQAGWLACRSPRLGSCRAGPPATPNKRTGQRSRHQQPTQPLTSQDGARGVSLRRRFGRDISIFDCYLRAPTGALARGYNPVCAFRTFHPGPDDYQLCYAG